MPEPYKCLEFLFEGFEIKNTEEKNKREGCKWMKLEMDSSGNPQKRNIIHYLEKVKNEEYIPLEECNKTLLHKSKKNKFQEDLRRKAKKFIETEENIVDKSKYFTVKIKRIIDGDTFEIYNNDVIRILGVDAKEKEDKLKHELATNFLKKFIKEDDEVFIICKHRDKNKRMLAFVYHQNQYNISVELLSFIDDKQGLLFFPYLSPDNKNIEFQYLKRN